MKRVEQVLATNLGLKEPEFRLRRYGHACQWLINLPNIQGKPDLARQHMIWNALETEWGEQAKQIVGMVLA